MKEILKQLLKEWGVKLVLKEMISICRDSDDKPMRELASDLHTSLDRYENREKSLLKIGS
jgi:hypothetical protein